MQLLLVQELHIPTHLEIRKANFLDLLLAVTANAVTVRRLYCAPLEQLHHERVGELGAGESQYLHYHLQRYQHVGKADQEGQ